MYRLLLSAGRLRRQRGWLTFNCLLALALLGGAQFEQAGLAKALDNAPTVRGARQIGVVTILEGSATVIRALAQFDALQGLRVLSGDLIRTEDNALLRIEYPEKTWMELGPQTLLQISHPAEKGRANRPGLYLLTGWLKLGCAPEAAGNRAVASKDMDLVELSGVMVMRATATDHAIFAEQGSARWINRATRGAAPLTLSTGDFLLVGPGKPAAIQSRPTPEFVAALPRPYKDTLPSRYSLFEAHVVVPKESRPFTYPEVEPWLDAEPAIRRQFLTLWRRKANDPAFRTPLDRDLALHPEWDPILHPEKYETEAPETTPPASEKSPPAPQRPPETADASGPRRN
jgi:hypothetical protein